MSSTPQRILVAEDHDINAQFLILLLQRMGLQADIARDGTEAVALLTARPYDAVLMDLYMPGLNGLQATRAIRALPAPACQTPVVLVSAESEQDIEGLGPDLQLAAIAAKPLRDAALRRALAACGIRVPDSPGPPQSSPPPTTPPASTPASTPPAAAGAGQPLDLVDEAQFRRAVSLMSPPLRIEMLQELFDAPHGAARVLRAALLGDSPRALHAAAHSLKGSAMMLGLPQLQQLCGRIEAQALASPAAADAALRDELSRVLQQTRDALGQLG